MHFDNHIELVVRSGETGKVTAQYEEHNAVADDFLCGTGRIFANEGGPDPNYNGIPRYGLPYCFLLKDGAAWTGFTFDRTNPWCPYACMDNTPAAAGFDAYWKPKIYYAPQSAGNPSLSHKLYFQWTQLPYNLSLKAIGLTGLQEPWLGNQVFGMLNSPSVVVPQTLVVLPSAINVNGLSLVGGIPTTTPDILEISYYLSIVGVS